MRISGAPRSRYLDKNSRLSVRRRGRCSADHQFGGYFEGSGNGGTGLVLLLRQHSHGHGGQLCQRCRTVVSGGDVNAACAISSKPTMLRSSGTWSERWPAAFITPRAYRSLPVKMAVGGWGRSSSSPPSRIPDSMLKTPSCTSSGRTGSPAS